MSRKTGLVLIVCSLALSFIGCGSYTTGNHSMLYRSGVGNTSAPTTGDNLPNPTATQTPGGNIVATPTPTPTKGVPPITFRVAAVGYTSVTLNVYAGKVLKMKFTPGIADTTVAGTGYTAQYSAMGVYVGLGTDLRPTPLLQNGLVGGTAQTSQKFDFSSNIATRCPANDANCRNDIAITVTKPNYDYWCLNFIMYCPYTVVHDTHPWNGTLSVQTDDTDPI